ncbi:MAG TPA: tetratricopeptide repeat protein, partial [Xanthomonadaceae bacterium]|nr:tetratricopeptide repeat protein [Xanthomonadaceae bacterium]
PAKCRDLLIAHEDQLDEHGDAAKRDAADYESVLGRCERALQNSAAARTHFEHALALRESLVGAGAEPAESLVDLAGLEADAGHGKIALAGMLDALQKLSASHDEQGPLAVSIWQNLGSLYRESGSGAAAENSYRTAERLAIALYGTGHPTTIDAERGLAAIYVDQGKLDQAEALFTQAQSQLTRLLGPDNPDLGSMSNSLGIIAWERGDVATAESRLHRAIDLWANSSHLHGGLFNLAMVLHGAGRDTEAEPLARRALALRTQQFGDGNGLVGVSLRQIGEIKLAQNDPAAAEPLLLRAQSILAADFGPMHTATGQAQLAIARLRVAQHRDADAAAQVADIQRRFKPSDAEHRRLLWQARMLAAQLQCAQTGTTAQGRRALTKVLGEIDAEMPVSVVRREAEAALHACGG